MENELAKDLDAADAKILYDAQVKKVLGNKIILAWILHYTVEAFSDLPPEEIVPYIEGEPQVGMFPVHHSGALQNNAADASQNSAADAEENRKMSVKESVAAGNKGITVEDVRTTGQVNMTFAKSESSCWNEGTAARSVSPAGQADMTLAKRSTSRIHEKITGLANEDKQPGEGTITYDVRFEAYLPGRNEPAKVIINVEAQKSYYPGYCIETRGVFYCGRMLSSQLGTEFEEPRYDDLKKVYSIWLCMNAPQYIGNAIAAYTFYKKDIVPGMPDRRQAYDKLSVVIICLNEKAESENKLNSMLNTLLSAALDVNEKKKKLEESFGISMKRNFQEEVNLMCNLSDLVEEKGRNEGIELGRSEGIELGHSRGIKEGIELGRNKEKDYIARKMIVRGTYSDQEILFLSGVDEERLCRLKEQAI